MLNKNVKKQISIGLIATTLIGANFVPQAVLAKNNVRDYKEDAQFLEWEGVLIGDDNGNLNLNDYLHRRDSVILLTRLLNQEYNAKNYAYNDFKPTWKDVRTDKYYLPFFAWAQDNAFYQGESKDVFNPKKEITAREYSLVLLRSLGYPVNTTEDWKNGFDQATKLGILKGLEIDKNDTITRGQMATMTVNALGTKLKDSKDMTLADKLGIELPNTDNNSNKPKPEGTFEDASILNVSASNLKEVEIQLDRNIENRNINLDNFSIKGYSLKRAYIQDDLLLLEVNGTLRQNKEYELTVKNNKNNEKYKFKAYDNKPAEVLSVEGLGNQAIIVKLSEPVKDLRIRNFKLDGKNFSGKISDTGREIIINVYNKLNDGEHELEILDLIDYAGFKSPSDKLSFYVNEDTTAPEVVRTKVYNDSIEVEFSEPVKVKEKSVYWLDGRNKVYANEVEQIDFKTYVFKFNKKQIPVHEITFFVENIEDFSSNKMKIYEESVRPELDLVRPEVIRIENKDSRTIEVHFSKDLDEKTATNKFNYVITYGKDKDVKIATAKLIKKNVVELTLLDNLDYSKEYNIKIDNVKDNTYLNNIMYAYEEDFNVDDKRPTVLKDVTFKEEKNETIIRIKFSKALDPDSATRERNFLVKINDRIYGLDNLDDADITLIRDNEILISIYGEDKIQSLTMFGIRDIDDNLINNLSKEIFNDEEAPALEKEAIAINKNEIKLYFNKSIAEAPKKAFLVLDNNTNIVKNIDIDGKIITIETEDLKADAKVTLTIDENLIIGENGLKVGKNDSKVVNIKDEIKPTINKKVVAVLLDDNKVQLNLEFDENVIITEDSFKYNSEILSQIRNKKLTKEEILEVSVEDNKVTIIIDITKDIQKIKDDKLEDKPLNVYQINKLSGLKDSSDNNADISNNKKLNETDAIKIIK